MYTIVGFRIINYTNKEGRNVNGVDFHLLSSEDSTEKDFYGQEVLQQYISADKISGEVSVGAVCELCYSVVRGQARITGIKIS